MIKKFTIDHVNVPQDRQYRNLGDPGTGTEVRGQFRVRHKRGNNDRRGGYKTSPRLRFLCQFSLSGPVPISSRLFIPGTSTMNHRRPDPQVFGQNTNILTCLRRCQHHVLQPQFLLPEFLQEKYSSALSMRFSLS